MNILVSGSTGFIGSHLIKKLSNDNKLLLIIRNEDKLNYNSNNIMITKLDENCKDVIIKFNPDIVIHLAAYSSSLRTEENILELINSNILFGSILLNILIETNFKYFINTGTFAEYRENSEQIDNAYFYSATKSAFREIIKYYQNIKTFKWINVIPYTVYGGCNSTKKVLDYILLSLNSNEPVNMTNGTQRLDFIHIDDVINFYVKLIKYLSISDINENFLEYYLGNGISISIRELTSIVESISQCKSNINWGALLYRENDIFVSTAPIHKNKNYFDWKASITLEEGLRKLIR